MRYMWRFASILGEITVVEKDGALERINIGEQVKTDEAIVEQTALLARAEQEICEYLVGKRTSFDLPLAPKGSAFQQAVWQAMRAIPYGATTSYGELAKAIANPRASRAVGGACHQNPLPIVIPCHRVVAKKGLGGFGLGIEMKKVLLKIENPIGEF